MKTKACTKCKSVLTTDNFSKNKNSKSGLEYRCKECRRKTGEEYRNKNKEKETIRHAKYHLLNNDKVKTYQKKYREENKEKIKEKDMKYRENNKDKEAIRRIKYYEANIGKYRIQHKKYKSENKEKINIATNKRRAIKRSLPATLTIEQWESSKMYFDNKCVYCGEKLPLEKEHFLAITKSGEFTVDNIIPSCRICNCNKHNKSFFEWYPNHKHYSKQREKKILKYLGYKNNIQQLSIL